MEVNQYMGMFLEESREHLQTLNRCLLELESEPSNLAILDEIFRSAHTIKGMSATMGFTTIAELTHEMENVLDLLRKAQLKADHVTVDILFKCVDTLEQLIECVSNNQESCHDVKPLIAKLQALANGSSLQDTAKVEPAVSPDAVEGRETLKLNATDSLMVHEAQSQGMNGCEITVSLKEGCLLKSARAYMVMRALEEIGEVIKCIPPVEELEKENFEYKFQVVIVSDREPEKIRETLLSISEVEQVDVFSYDKISLAEQSAPVQSIDHKPAATLLQEGKSANGEHPSSPQAQIDKKPKSGQSVRVDIERLDTLLNLVGELVINKTRLEQIGLTHRLNDLVETIELMDRITTDLQTVVMKVRMVPVGQVFNRFPRMVRDLSRDLKKEVNLIIQGEETELDRTVIDEIGDPLVHLLRNAIDHGIESPADRKAKGKNPIGEVKLIARHEGNNVIILVEDDGKGINPDVLKAKAVQKGLLTQAEADKLDNAEAIRLLFLPGFSTAETITDVSGRGVGMDAVKTKIEALGGMVDIETKVNEGSKFKIRLPLTLAIIQALLVKIYEEIYAIPLSSIDSTINITTSDIKTIQNQEVILLRGQIIPIIRLAEKLNVPRHDNNSQDELFVVIVHMGNQRAGIIVDTLIGQQEIVIKSLGKLLAGIKVIAGATILGNGQVALILDVGSIIQ